MELFYYVMCFTFNVFLSLKMGHCPVLFQCYIHVFIKERDGVKKIEIIFSPTAKSMSVWQQKNNSLYFNCIC